MTSDRDHRWIDGRRNGIKWAVRFLHERAQEMGDPKAADILNAAAFNMGVEAKAASQQNQPLYLGEKTINTLLHGKLLSDAEKRKLIERVTNGAIPANAGQEPAT